MRAGADDGVKTAGVLSDVVGRTHDPDTHGFLESLVDAHPVLGRKTDLELRWRFVDDIGKHEAAGRRKRGRGSGGERAPCHADPGAARHQR
jgi:hypothetical protein